MTKNGIKKNNTMVQSEYDNWMLLNRYVNKFENNTYAEISKAASWGVKALMSSINLDIDMQDLLNENIYTNFVSSIVYKPVPGDTCISPINRLDGVINDKVVCLNGIAFLKEPNNITFSECMQKYDRYFKIIMQKCGKNAFHDTWLFSFNAIIMPDEINPD